jgi:hypothetical protein
LVPSEGSDGTNGRWRIARRVAPERVVSTVDPQARHAHKTRSRRQDGYKAHVVVEPDTGIITDTRLTPAAGSDNSDATIGVELLLPDQPHADQLGTDRPSIDQPGAQQPGAQGFGSGWEVLADSAYAIGDALADITRAGHTPIINPGRCARPWKAGSPSTTSRSPNPPATSPVRELPERAHPPAQPHPHRHLRGAVSQLPATRPLHHQ